MPDKSNFIGKDVTLPDTLSVYPTSAIQGRIYNCQLRGAKQCFNMNNGHFCINDKYTRKLNLHNNDVVRIDYFHKYQDKPGHGIKSVSLVSRGS